METSTNLRPREIYTSISSPDEVEKFVAAEEVEVIGFRMVKFGERYLGGNWPEDREVKSPGDLRLKSASGYIPKGPRYILKGLKGRAKALSGFEEIA